MLRQKKRVYFFTYGWNGRLEKRPLYARIDLVKDLKLAGVRDASLNDLIDRALLIEQAGEENKEEK